jgi:hypothetical protein
VAAEPNTLNKQILTFLSSFVGWLKLTTSPMAVKANMGIDFG